MSVQDEQTHFQRLDELKLEQEHKERLAQIKATAEVEKEKIGLKNHRLNIWQDWAEPLQMTVVGLAAVGALIALSGGIWWMWASSPSDTPEEMKQDRAYSCTVKNGEDDGKHDHTWYPDAANGEGLCLPKDAPVPVGSK